MAVKGGEGRLALILKQFPPVDNSLARLKSQKEEFTGWQTCQRMPSGLVVSARKAAEDTSIFPCRVYNLLENTGRLEHVK